MLPNIFSPKPSSPNKYKVDSRMIKSTSVKESGFAEGSTLFPAINHSNDKSKILSIVQQFDKMWNDHACAGLADLYSDNAIFINLFNMEIDGKNEIEERHKAILKTFLKDSKIKTLNTTLKILSDDVISAIVRWELHGFRMPEDDFSLPGVKICGVFVHTFVCENSKWLISLTQNSIAPILK